jgi:hypothetical protein
MWGICGGEPWRFGERRLLKEAELGHIPLGLVEMRTTIFCGRASRMTDLCCLEILGLLGCPRQSKIEEWSCLYLLVSIRYISLKILKPLFVDNIGSL